MELLTFVPDAALWTSLIAGFAAIVMVARVRTARVGDWEDLVSKLSGRIRED